VNAEPAARAEILRIAEHLPGEDRRRHPRPAIPSRSRARSRRSAPSSSSCVPLESRKFVRTGKVAIARGPKARLRRVDEKLGKAAPRARGHPGSSRIGFADLSQLTGEHTKCRRRFSTTRMRISDSSRAEDRHCRLWQPGTRPRLNLKDSGQDVTIGLYKGSKGWTAAEKAGFKVMTVGDAAAAADIIMSPSPRPDPAAGVRGVHQGHPGQGQDPHVRPRLQHPLQPGGAVRPTWTSL
jgi:hypothetical protein